MNSVYFILGTPGSGRRGIVRDLVENGLGADEQAVVMLSTAEATDPQDDKLAALANVEVRRWSWAPPDFPRQKFAAGTTVFLLADPLASPIDQLEALKPWLAVQGAELARIFCVVDCALAEQQPVLRQWFDGCIRFADVVFLTNRSGVGNKWLSDFLKHFKDERFPCHFVQVKAKGDLPTPLVWLDPTPRRVSQYFEEDYVDLSDVVIETGDDEDDEGEPVEPGEDDGIIPPEPYFVRQRSGRRDKELPDIRAYMPKK